MNSIRIKIKNIVNIIMEILCFSTLILIMSLLNLRDNIEDWNRLRLTKKLKSLETEFKLCEEDIDLWLYGMNHIVPRINKIKQKLLNYDLERYTESE